MHRFFYYLFWTVGIGVVIFLGAKYELILRRNASETFNATSFILYSTLFSIVIGMILRFPKLMKEINERKSWQFDWIKLVVIGIPTFVISTSYVLLPYLPEGIIVLLPQVSLFSNETIQIVAGVIFGYVLLDSLTQK